MTACQNNNINYKKNPKKNKHIYFLFFIANMSTKTRNTDRDITSMVK